MPAPSPAEDEVAYLRMQGKSGQAPVAELLATETLPSRWLPWLSTTSTVEVGLISSSKVSLIEVSTPTVELSGSDRAVTDGMSTVQVTSSSSLLELSAFSAWTATL